MEEATKRWRNVHIRSSTFVFVAKERKSERKKIFRRPRCNSEGNIKMNVKGTELGIWIKCTRIRMGIDIRIL
jgi:transcription elongation factor Elf1